MSAESEFFLASAPSVVRLDCLEISHPDFSQTYRLVRNAPVGVVVEHATTDVSWIFDGVDDEVTMGDVLDFDWDDPFSIEITGSTTTASRNIVSKYDADQRGYALQMIAGKLRFYLGNSLASVKAITVDTTGIYGDGIVRQYRVEYDGSGAANGVAITVNASPVSTTIVMDTLDGHSTINGASLQIGGHGPAASGPWRDLSIRAGVSLVGAWNLDEEDSNASGGIVDHGPGGFDGTPNFDPTPTGEAEFTYSYCPARVMPIASSDDLVQALAVTLGDVGDIIAQEIEAVWAANGMNVRPTLTYRAYRSDDLEAPILGSLRTLEIANVTTTREGATFEARAPELNATRTGELYSVERFPMLRGFF
jgi:hypothetical protein